eukprot:scaffold28059_cov67-Attheya_sp.AAC.2
MGCELDIRGCGYGVVFTVLHSADLLVRLAMRVPWLGFRCLEDGFTIVESIILNGVSALGVTQGDMTSRGCQPVLVLWAWSEQRGVCLCRSSTWEVACNTIWYRHSVHGVTIVMVPILALGSDQVSTMWYMTNPLAGVHAEI